MFQDNELLESYGVFESSGAEEIESMGAKVNYEIGSFVVVRVVEDESNTSNWVVEVPPTILDESGNVSKLRVHWLDTHSMNKVCLDHTCHRSTTLVT